MMNRKTLLFLLGFLLFSLGILSLVVSLVGIEFAFMTWLDTGLGHSGAAAAKIAIALVGIVLMYMTRTDAELENDEYTLAGRK